MAERVTIDAKLCRQVELMLRGGATAKETAEMMGISATTVSRIKAAGYDAVQFELNTVRRREADRAAREEAEERKAIQEESKELPGQMKLDLVYDQSIAEEYRKEHPEEYRQEKPAEEPAADNNKMMRFYAALTDKILKKLDILIEEVQKIPLF